MNEIKKKEQKFIWAYVSFINLKPFTFCISVQHFDLQVCSDIKRPSDEVCIHTAISELTLTSSLNWLSFVDRYITCEYTLIFYLRKR